jgi:hypothetical protein
VPVHHAPGLQLAALHRVPAHGAVVEGDRPVIPDRLPQRAEGGLTGVHPGLDDRLRAVLGVDAGRAQLEQGAGGRASQLGALPHPGGQPEHRGLVRLQGDLGQLVGFPLDPVAGLLVPRR